MRSGAVSRFNNKNGGAAPLPPVRDPHLHVKAAHPAVSLKRLSYYAVWRTDTSALIRSFDDAVTSTPDSFLSGNAEQLRGLVVPRDYGSLGVYCVGGVPRSMDQLCEILWTHKEENRSLN
jgi:hypothetical protein